MSRATELVLEESKGNKELVTCMTDAIALAIHGCHDMNMQRQAMKKELNKDYTALCNSSTVDASSEFLFGDLSKLAKDITDANKLTKKCAPRINKATSAGTTDILLVDVGTLALKVTALAPISVDEMIFCPRVIHQKAE